MSAVAFLLSAVGRSDNGELFVFPLLDDYLQAHPGLALDVDFFVRIVG